MGMKDLYLKALQQVSGTAQANPTTQTADVTGNTSPAKVPWWLTAGGLNEATGHLFRRALPFISIDKAAEAKRDKGLRDKLTPKEEAKAYLDSISKQEDAKKQADDRELLKGPRNY